MELISFLRNCEQLFAIYDVPASLQAILIRPFLNARARTYLTKLDPQVSGGYTQLKDALLQEFKLSANVYLERFNTCIKSADDTYVSFASKLTGLVDYYHESRHVTAYEQLCELLICDRIKTVLSEGCLRYILSIESANDTGWLRKKDLTDAVDRYMASHPRNDRPKAFAVGQTPQAMSKQNYGVFGQAKAASPNAMPPKFNGNSQSNKNKCAFPPPGEHAGNVRYCFHCGKPGHVMKSCVLRQHMQSVKPPYVKRVGVLSKNSIISHANEPLANHGAVCGRITEATCMTRNDDVGVFDVRHDEVTSGHLIDTGEAITLTDSPVFVNESASTEVTDSSSANSGSGAASDATSSCVSRGGRMRECVNLC